MLKEGKVQLGWDNAFFQGGDGILTGCDETMEWMLKWFWKHYSLTNTLPVTFLDFGLSKSARMWCEKRMRVIPCPISKEFENEDFSFPEPSQWSPSYKRFSLKGRKFWFTKICSFLKTPYSRSLWIDIDCKFLGAIDDVFKTCNHPNGVGLTLDKKEVISLWKKGNLLKKEAKGYQAGCVLFKRESPLIEKWALGCLEEHKVEFADQTLLNSIIERDNMDIPLIPEKYHWLNPYHVPKGTKIIHYIGRHGKSLILKEI